MVNIHYPRFPAAFNRSSSNIVGLGWSSFGIFFRSPNDPYVNPPLPIDSQLIIRSGLSIFCAKKKEEINAHVVFTVIGKVCQRREEIFSRPDCRFRMGSEAFDVDMKRCDTDIYFFE